MVRFWTIILVSATLLPAQKVIDRAWSILAEGSAEESAQRREAAVAALGMLSGHRKAQQTAEKLLQGDSNPQVRAAAATALGQMGASSAIPKLKAAVKDESAEVVLAAAHSLYLLRDPMAYEVYYAVLTGKRKTGDNLLESQIRKLKDPRALAKMGFEQGIGFIPFGSLGYRVVRAMIQDDASPVRAAAAQKLIRDPDPKSDEALAAATKDDNWLVRAAAVDALARRGRRASLTTVLPMLDDENHTVRYTAAAAVIRLSARPVRRTTAS